METRERINKKICSEIGKIDGEVYPFFAVMLTWMPSLLLKDGAPDTLASSPLQSTLFGPTCDSVGTFMEIEMLLFTECKFLFSDSQFMVL